VDEYLTLERYATVTHLVSNVTGQLRPGASPWDVVKALFPGGTITGCPKVRCMQILSDTEPVPRDLYTGSVGYIEAGGDALSFPRMDLNILIRSLYLKPLSLQTLHDSSTGPHFRYNASIHAGAGIVADSVGPHEYRECLRKASTLFGVLRHHDSDRSEHPDFQPG
jgi:anthranilate/para-aminobenzoate synthase component I